MIKFGIIKYVVLAPVCTYAAQYCILYKLFHKMS